MRISELLPRGNRGKNYGALRLVKIHPLRLVRQSTEVKSPADVYRFMLPYVRREVCEVFWILALDARHQVIADQPIIITTGLINSSLAHPREVFRAAIVAGASAIVLVHNHPSGDPTPSPDDFAVTDQLVSAGRVLDLPVHDHVVIGCERFISFAEARVL